jgi:CRP-like cAMP-binding protein
LSRYAAVLGDGVKRSTTATAVEANTTLLSIDKEAFAACLATGNDEATRRHKVQVLRHVRAFSEMPLEAGTSIHVLCKP